MFKYVHHRLLCFDIEWVPDPHAARALLNVDEGADLDVCFEALWAYTREREALRQDFLKGRLRGVWESSLSGEELDKKPFLKLMMSRVVTVAGVLRVVEGGEVRLKMVRLPELGGGKEERGERQVLKAFFEGLAHHNPHPGLQLVGYRSSAADVPILLQRAAVHALEAPSFAARPKKPWEGLDYFDARNSDYHIDLYEALGGRYGNAPSLNEAAIICGIPGKMGVSGEEVWRLYREGDLPSILAYNECDAVSTYLLFLRLACVSGLLGRGGFQREERVMRDFLQLEIEKGAKHFVSYLEEWNRLGRLSAKWEMP